MQDRRPGTPGTGSSDARGSAAASGRDARLKAALKANIARRKARAQALDGDLSDDQGGISPQAQPEDP
jgi:hypothetical protein